MHSIQILILHWHFSIQCRKRLVIILFKSSELITNGLNELFYR